MRKRWIGVAVLVAMAGSWGGAVRAQVTDDPEVPLSYLLKQQQIGFAREFVWFARDLISAGVGTHIASAHWEKDNMVLTVGGPYEADLVHLTFRHLGWDPQHTDEEFGPRKLLDTTDKTYQGAGFLAALAESEEGLDYKQTQTVTVEHKREVTMDRETHIDIGAEVGTTIGGENFGVSVEAKLTTEFGTRVDNSQTDEESRSKETAKEINYLFPAGRDTLLTIATRTVSTEQWLKINGVSDMGFSVRWPVSLTWANSQDHPPRANLVGGGNPLGLETTGRGDSQMYSMTFANWDEFETMMEGFNTDFPAMAGWQFARGDIINGEQIGPHIARIRAPSMRAVVFSGIQREDEDGVLTLDIEDVTGQDLCDIQTRLQLTADLVHDPDGRACTGVTEGLPQYAVAGSGDPLVIRRTAAAEDGTVAFLESLQLGGVRARTNGTRAGFDFSAVPGGGQQWTGLVYRTGDEGETYRSAIELPGGHLGEGEPYDGNPWDWNAVEIFNDPIEAGR